MPRINLLQRKKQKAIQKASIDAVFIIATDKNDKQYYVNTVKDSNGAVVWTPQRGNAMMFHTETGTQHFIHVYLKNRDVHLIQTHNK